MPAALTLSKAELLKAVHVETIGGQWCCAGSDLHFVAAQVVPPELAQMDGDQSRPSTISALRGLLGTPQRYLAQIVTQGKPAVLALPELALGFCDWEAVDVLVRSYPSSLIVTAGFGITAGEKISQWRTADGSLTKRRFGWPEDHNPASGRRYNGGWCWVHTPQETVCICFLKNFAEQSLELPFFDGLDGGLHTLCVETDDVSLFPIICADLLWKTPSHEYVVHRRIAAYLENRADPAKKALTLGLLYQRQHHGLWRSSIESLAHNAAPAVLNIALVNCGFNLVSRPEPDDQWRSFSGVYVTRNRAKGYTSFNAARGFQTDGTSSTVSRDTEACAVGGPLRWDFGADQGSHVWATKMDYAMEVDGALGTSRCASKVKYELKRFIKRFGVHPPGANAELWKEALTQIETQLDNGATPKAEHISNSVLQGESVPRADERAPDPEKYHDIWEALLLGLVCLGALRMQPGNQWQVDIKAHGQLVSPTAGARFLVWSSPSLRVSALRQKLLGWVNDLRVSTPLVAYIRGPGGGVTQTREILRRSNFASAPHGEKGDITDSAQDATVTIEPLGELDALLESPSRDAFLSRLDALIAKATTKVRPDRTVTA